MTNAASIAFFALMLILPISALISRRMPVGTVFKMAFAWIAIFVGIGLAILIWQRVASGV